MDREAIEQGVRLILEGIGEDATREGLLDTPRRVASMYAEILTGMDKNPSEHFEKRFGEQHHELVLVKDIAFYSMCEHHLMPFSGLAHVGYIPGKDGRVCGLPRSAA
jgi:GTP cyclohydrolase I